MVLPFLINKIKYKTTSIIVYKYISAQWEHLSPARYPKTLNFLQIGDGAHLHYDDAIMHVESILNCAAYKLN